MKRPIVDADIIKIAANKTAENTSNIEPCDVETLAKDIVKHYRRHMNGYDLAKELDCEWDVDPIFVHEMDMIDCYVREAHKKKCYEWVKKEKIKPPLSIGTKIKEGVIDSVYQYYPACYQVKENGCTRNNRFLIIKFEDAVATS